MRARFFGPEASTRARHRAPGRSSTASAPLDLDIRDADGVDGVFARHAREIELVVHTAAQPSHDWAASDPADRLHGQRQRHAEPARRPRASTRPTRRSSSARRTRSTATGPTPAARGARDAARAARATTAGTAASISRCRSTSCTHSLFGASKAAADLLVQEYGRYFGMPTVCFRGGCLTGPQHAGARAARLPRLPDALHGLGRAVLDLRLRRQAGARQHPRPRRGARLRRLPRARRAPPPSTTSAAAARATSRCSRRSRCASRSPGRRAGLHAARRGAGRRPHVVDLRPRRVQARLPGSGG